MLKFGDKPHRCAVVFGLLALLAATPAAAQEPPAGLAEQIDQALSERCLNAEETAVSVVELPGGTPVYTRRADTPLLPASVMKLVTTAAALHHLGPEYRFHTDVLYTGARQGETLTGDLILRGHGDPVLTPEKLWQIASRLKDQGITRINGSLIADDSFFDGYDRAPGWDEDRSQRAYDAKIGALSVNFNVIAVHFQPAAQAGAAPTVWLEPAPAYIQVKNEGTTVQRGKNTLRIRRSDDGQNVIEITGKLPLSAGEEVAYLNIEDPARYAAETFRLALAQAGVQIAGSTRRGQSPANASLLYRHDSPPLSWILKELNTYSNNFIAEQIVKTLAATEVKTPGSHADGLRLMGEFLHGQGVDTRGLVLADGSGLSRQNRFTAQAMTEFLSAMLPRFDIGPDFMAAMRVLGADGAVSKRLKNSPARGNVRAKTGTMAGVRNLAGYVSSQNGRLFAYAMFLNGNRCGISGADKVEDQIVDALYLQGGEAPRFGNAAGRNSVSLWTAP